MGFREDWHTEKGALWLVACGLGSSILCLIYWLIEPAACEVAVVLTPKDQAAGPCLEFWFNRYQTLLIGLAGIASALMAARLAWNAVQLQINQAEVHANKNDQEARDEAASRAWGLVKLGRTILDAYAIEEQEDRFNKLEKIVSFVSVTTLKNGANNIKTISDSCRPSTRVLLMNISRQIETVASEVENIKARIDSGNKDRPLKIIAEIKTRCEVTERLLTEG